jgi:hypothetical protein
LVDVEEADTHSTFVSRSTDEAQAYSVSFGLSAGIDKLLSVKESFTYSGKTETQNKNQSRYTVSRKVAKVWAAHLDVPSLALHETFLGPIKTRTYELLSRPTPDKSQGAMTTRTRARRTGAMTTKAKSKTKSKTKSEADWWNDDFVPSWGTHYANSITHGSITLAKTWFSLHSEQTAVEQKLQIKESASATIEVAKVGADFALEQEWKTKTGLEMSTDDTEHFGIGTPDPVSIFLDLRPSSELLSPIFLPYDDKDDWGKFAPWVWTTVRSDFEDWLTAQGLNQPIDENRIEDYRPRGFTITLEDIALKVPAGSNIESLVRGLWTPTVTGNIWFSQLQDADTPGAKAPNPTPGTVAVTVISKESTKFDPAQSLVSRAEGLSDSASLTESFDSSLHASTVAKRLGCRLATSAGNVKAGPKGGLCVGLTVDVTINTRLSEYAAGSLLRCAAEGLVVEFPFSNLPKGQVHALEKTVVVAASSLSPDVPVPGVTLEFTVAASDNGPFPD